MGNAGVSLTGLEVGNTSSQDSGLEGATDGSVLGVPLHPGTDGATVPGSQRLSVSVNRFFSLPGP